MGGVEEAAEGVRVGPWRAGEGGGWAVGVWACTRAGGGRLAAARGGEGEGERARAGAEADGAEAGGRLR